VGFIFKRNSCGNILKKGMRRGACGVRKKKNWACWDPIAACQRAAVSIPSNIAEGDESGTDRLSIRYFYIAKGSIAELMTQVIIANEIGYVDFQTKDELVDECDKLSSMLNNLIKSRNK
jgi:four helix bundle protein